MQIFPKSLNVLPLVLAGVTFVAGGAATFGLWIFASPKNLQVGYTPEQPVPYSHRLHAGQLGLDCRYCHANVERSSEAMLPPSQTCMGCHAQVKTTSAKLAPIRDSFANDMPVEWIRVHKLPDHVYFNHSIHVGAGVGCSSCHGRIDQMDVVRVDQPISMGWCLDCHRDPGKNLRPHDQITKMDWVQTASPEEQAAHASSVNPPQNCSGCHR